MGIENFNARIGNRPWNIIQCLGVLGVCSGLLQVLIVPNSLLRLLYASPALNSKYSWKGLREWITSSRGSRT